MKKNMTENSSDSTEQFHKQVQGRKPGVLGNQRGSFMVIAAILMLVSLGMVAIGVEVGRWYIVRAELSKAVDATAIAGAKNYSNPYVDSETFVQQMATANYSPGFMGTEGMPTFSVTFEDPGKVYMTGSANVLNTVGKVLDSSSTPSGNFEKTKVGSLGAAQLRKSEVILVLDRSGSMSGTPIEDLKTAAVGFLDNFENTDDHNKFGLVTFASGVKVDYALDHDFYTPMVTAINSLSASGWTNVDDALHRADTEPGFTDQEGVPGDQWVDQYLIFFSDGNPTAFRGDFVINGNTYDAVVSQDDDANAKLYDPDKYHAVLGSVVGAEPSSFETGDGKPLDTSNCGSTHHSTKWQILADSAYGIHTYEPLEDVDPQACGIDRNELGDYVNQTAKSIAIDRAQAIKAKGVKIYTIGLGSVDQGFLAQISSGPEFQYHTPSSSELTNLFQQIANDLKLRLIK